MELGSKNSILQLLDFYTTTFGVRNILLAAIYAGKMVVTASDRVIEASDSITNATVILVINQYRGGEKVAEQQQIEKILIHGKERVLESVNYQ